MSDADVEKVENNQAIELNEYRRNRIASNQVEPYNVGFDPSVK